LYFFILNYIFLITKIEILFYICLFLIYSFIINKNNFSLKIELINTIKKLTFLYIVKNSISLIVNKSFASSNIVKTSISLNSFTIFNRQIFVKTIIISTNFLFNLLILFVN